MYRPRSDRTVSAALPTRPTHRRLSLCALVACLALGDSAHAREATLTLQAALDLALERSGAIREAEQAARAQASARHQAALLPNPIIESETEDLAGTGRRFSPGISQPQTTVRLSQPILLGGDRGARTRAADASVELAELQRRARELDVRRTVVERFAEVQGAQELLGWTAEILRLARRVEDTIRERVAAGFASPVDETRAIVATAEVMAAHLTAERRLESARVALGAIWGDQAPTFERVAGDDALGPPPPDLARLIDQRTDNPDLGRWPREQARRGALVDVERARAVPDVAITAGYRRFHDTGNDALVVGIAIPLPVFDRNQGAIAEATALAAAATAEGEATDQRLIATIADAHSDLHAAYNDVTTADAIIVPGARSAYEATHEGYAGGKFGLLDVLMAQRTLFDAQARRIQRLIDLRRAQAHLDRLVGGHLTEVSR